MNKKLTESLENYLETIGMLVRKNKIARVKDISKELGVKNSSVNIALNVLADKGLIVHEKYGYVELTSEGQKIADDIQHKEDILLRFFTEISTKSPAQIVSAPSTEMSLWNTSIVMESTASKSQYVLSVFT